MGLFPARLLACLVVVAGLFSVSVAWAASPGLVVDAESGDVLYQDEATTPWFPASTTKLMTVYVALSAAREGRITMQTPLMVSPRAASMAPSKMGFRPGTLVTLDNALKMLMVKSPNDIAVTVAEGVSGSVEDFANDMNVYAARLGLHESHFVNPNGLPDERHVSSARDMAIIARALLRDFPEERGLFGIGVLAFGNRLINNHNGLLGRYPGIDGMKTGFTCAAGYNIVASAERNGRHLIAVIMGAPSNGERNDRVAALFDHFMAAPSASIGALDTLPASTVTTPPDNRPVVCSRARGAAVAEAEAEDAQMTGGSPSSSLSPTRAAFVPVRVFIGPEAGWTGRIAQARDTGAKELNPAPVKQSAYAERATPSATDGNGAIEGAAPGPGAAPMALLGATPLAPAAAAVKHLVRATPGLGLGVGARRRLARRHAIAPVTATLAKPRIIATAETAAVPPKPPAKGGHDAKPTKGPRVAKAMVKPVPRKATTAAAKR